MFLDATQALDEPLATLNKCSESANNLHTTSVKALLSHSSVGLHVIIIRAFFMWRPCWFD
jgi:hypothetical protein